MRPSHRFRLVVAVVLSACAAAFVPTVSSARPAPGTGAPQEALTRFVHRLELGTPRHQGAITIIPIRLSDTPSNVLALSEALRDGAIHVHEIGEGRVNQLEVENTGKSAVFIMAGQILVGAKQNRVLQRDLLLPPMSGRVTVDAYCVQHGRWSYQDGQTSFSRSDNFSNPQVRQAAKVAKAQSAVWASVDDTRRSVGATSAGHGRESAGDTSDLNEIYENKPVRDKIVAAESAFRDLPQAVPDMQGAVVLLDRRIVAVDVFGDRAMFRRLWRPLLASYLLEGARRDKSEVAGASEMARTFLDRALEGEMRRVATPGSGVLVEFAGPYVGGGALLTSQTVLHLDLFPGRGSAPSDDNTQEPPIVRPRYR